MPKKKKSRRLSGLFGWYTPWTTSSSLLKTECWAQVLISFRGFWHIKL